MGRTVETLGNGCRPVSRLRIAFLLSAMYDGKMRAAGLYPAGSPLPVIRA